MISDIASGRALDVKKEARNMGQNYPYIYRDIVSLKGYMSRKKSHNKTATVDWKAVGKRLRELRGFEMKQADLARRLGVSQGYLSTIEHGRREIGVEVLLAISREFGKSLEWLLTGKE